MALSEDFVDEPMFQTLALLSECLCQELAATGGPGLCYCGLWLGSAAPPLGVADCKDKDCGVAWVRLVSAFPSGIFPTPDQEGVTRCASPMVYQVEIGVARCAPRPEGRAMFPDAQAMFEANRLYMSDMRAAARALRCCLPEANKKAGGSEILVALGAWDPLEYAAGKSGGTWTGYFGRA